MVGPVTLTVNEVVFVPKFWSTTCSVITAVPVATPNGATMSELVPLAFSGPKKTLVLGITLGLLDDADTVNRFGAVSISLIT